MPGPLASLTESGGPVQLHRGGITEPVRLAMGTLDRLIAPGRPGLMAFLTGKFDQGYFHFSSLHQSGVPRSLPYILTYHTL